MSSCEHSPVGCSACLRAQVEELEGRLSSATRQPMPETRATTGILQHIMHGLQAEVRRLSEELGKVKEENNVLRGELAALRRTRAKRKGRTRG